MALSTTVTKKSVTQSQPGLFQVTFNMQYKDDAAVLIDRDFSRIYRTGQAATVVYKDVLDEMQSAIAAYKAEQVIYNNATLDTVVTTLNNNIGV